MTLESRQASSLAVPGNASLYALCMLVFGASGVLLGAWAFGSSGRSREALGIGLGGGLGLVISTPVFAAWVRALRLSTRALWRAFAGGLLLKAFTLLAGTLLIHFAVPAASAASFAISFVLAVIWVSALGVPYIHRRGGRRRGE